MLPDDIDADAFYTAHERAMANTTETNREALFVEELTRHLIAELSRMQVATVLDNRDRASSKIQATLQDILEKNGIEFMTQRIPLKAALEFTLASRMTHNDMDLSPKIKESGLFKLDLPGEPDGDK